jgi:GNAT superfamily N-acetyltransferase
MSSGVPSSLHRFVLRPLRAADRPYLEELARHTYDGFDYICDKLDHWLRHPHLFVCLAFVYEGTVSAEEVAAAKAAAAAGSSSSSSLLGLRSDAPPIPPRTFIDAAAATMGGGKPWTHEEFFIAARGAAATAAGGAPSPSPSPDAEGQSVACSNNKGDASAVTTAAAEAAAAALSPFKGHVVSMEVLCLFDGGETGFLQALRVHPALRGFGLSSLLHARLISLAQRVFHVRRVRETTTTTNDISLHLGRKHGLTRTRAFDCGIIPTKRCAEAILPQIRRQLAFLGVPEPPLDLQLLDGEEDASTAASSSSSSSSSSQPLPSLVRGTSEQVLRFVSQHATDDDVNLLRQYWMTYAVTTENLVYLCTEAVLPQGVQYNGRPSRDPQNPGHLLCATQHPYFLVTSPVSATAAASSSAPAAAASPPSSSPSAACPIGAYSIVLTSQDLQSCFRTFSLHAARPPVAASGKEGASEASSSSSSSGKPEWDSDSYRHALLHMHYHLSAAVHNRHETAAFHVVVDDPPATSAGLGAAAVASAGSSSAYTTAPYAAREVAHVQFSTPEWFGRAFLALEERMIEQEGSESSSSSSSDEERFHVPPPGQGWAPYSARGPMVLLERTFE